MIEHPFYNDAGFWGFLTAIIGSIRWLARVIYLYFEKKAKLDQSIENIRNANAIELIKQLQAQVKVIIPIVDRHERVVQSLQTSMHNFCTVESNMVEASRRLEDQYKEFNKVVPNITTAQNAIMDDLSNIKTEILELKKGSGNLFVTTKKG